MVDALYVAPRSIYKTLLGAERCWDEKRDARLYEGPGPVITHPPCAAWCQLAGVREAKYGYPRGEDGGLFAAALVQLRRVGGVLEHPAYSKAWPAHGLTAPSKGGWTRVQDEHGAYWVCQVSQCAYGHRARKRTWLLYVGAQPPFDIDWSEPYVPGSIVISGAKNHVKRPTERMWTREAKATPEPFARELIRLAAHAAEKQGKTQ
jgi:hypothetical protein